MESKVKVKTFLSRFYRKREIQDDEDIFELGFANSLFAMQMVMFLEKEFNIRIETQDMDLSNFRTLNKINELIERKTA
ncbi:MULTISPECIES: acyl carrier protein [Bacillales]|uniref:Acyl carrier protein n=1 Tax=Paenibacillus xylanexedens TaxID=528191 RepID=A0ABS4RTJ9_PAEXY|nr:MULTISPECIES: acyl carrier protein [Paenibacillus]KAA8748066.1 acyl carrier protein [Paenibacillus sp. UASWS1643]KLU56022.1 D-alanyl carrier protein [Paenibacillus sp. VT-400]MBD8839067.1 acyl carrier protein [Paenibacillus sp. CFBP 13594]MBP2245786.1 acyl carrier protein [Paenibacillus xylanexedens]MBT2284094.1 acyl carrier protein [Paenibacillus polymyxa]